MDLSRPPQPPRGNTLRWRSVIRPEWLIDAWFDLLPPLQSVRVRELHELVLGVAPGLTACVKWGNLIYLKDGRPVAQLTPHRHAVHLQLPMPRHLRMRSRAGKGGPGAGTLRFRLTQALDADEVAQRVRAAMRYAPR